MLAVSPALTLLLPRSSSSPIHFCGRLAFPQPSSSSCVQGLAPPPSCRRAQSTFGFPKRAERLYRPCATSEHHDPGHWNFSPEWWGTQGGGWGHDAGKVVFMQHSHCGNGEVGIASTFGSGVGSRIAGLEHQTSRDDRAGDRDGTPRIRAGRAVTCRTSVAGLEVQRDSAKRFESSCAKWCSRCCCWLSRL